VDAAGRREEDVRRAQDQGARAAGHGVSGGRLEGRLRAAQRPRVAPLVWRWFGPEAEAGPLRIAPGSWAGRARAARGKIRAATSPCGGGYGRYESNRAASAASGPERLGPLSGGVFCSLRTAAARRWSVGPRCILQC
jgi:hypothetical protein